VRRAFITDTPTLTFQQAHNCVFGEFTAGHQGALPFGKLPVVCRAAPPFNMLVCPCPGSMRDVAFAGTIEPCTLWIRTRESGIALWRWRRPCHNSPPVAMHGLKDTESTPVSPRYCPPGLPILEGVSELLIPC